VVARAQLAAARTAASAPRGIVTQLAELGAIVQAGQPLYTLDGSHPVVLLTGSTPAWRAMGPGMTDGDDVRQLERNLATLGIGGSDLTVDRHWDEATTAAVKAWQARLGIPQTGAIELGQIVFQPGPIRITTRAVDLGGTVAPGGAVLTATTTDRIVSVALNTANQGSVKVGDHVDIVLPDGVTTTTGEVTTVGSVATAGENGGNPTIPVTITLDDPAATGVVDQAPVQVAITTATATDVLAVPVQALVALLEGGYAVELTDGTTNTYVGVELGLFANGWVEIRGDGIQAGQTVVVPA
jgi:peptidoglycan hydrolase-like protein with peptidoglycan-binding domain